MGRSCLLVMMLVGCGASTPAAPPPQPRDASLVTPVAPVAPAPVDAAPAVVHQVCIPPTFAGTLVHFSATDDAATVCLRENRPRTGPLQTLCVSVDLATGAHAAAPDAWGGEAPAETSPFVVKDDERGVRLCKGTRCTRLALRPIPAWPDGPRLDHGIQISADGTRALGQYPGERQVHLLDTATGREKKLLDVAPCTSDFRFLDDTIWIQGSQCSWVDEFSYLFDKDGRPLAVLDQVEVKFMRPVRFAGSTWVIPATGGAGFVMFDAITGAVVGSVANLPQYDEAKCMYCTPVTVKGQRERPPIARTPSGTLLVFSAGIAVIAPPYTALARHLPLNVCASTTP